MKKLITLSLYLLGLIAVFLPGVLIIALSTWLDKQYGPWAVLVALCAITVAIFVLAFVGSAAQWLSALRRALRPSEVIAVENAERKQLEAQGWLHIHSWPVDRELERMYRQASRLTPFIRRFDHITYLSLEFIRDPEARNRARELFNRHYTETNDREPLIAFTLILQAHDCGEEVSMDTIQTVFATVKENWALAQFDMWQNSKRKTAQLTCARPN